MTASPRPYQPAELVPPGETLVEWLTSTDMTQAEFAKRAGLTPKHITQVVKGKVGISPEVALAFERVTAIPDRFWMTLDATYQAARHRMNEQASLAARVDLVDRFPIRELIRRGYVDKTADKVDQLRGLLHFFGVGHPETLEEVWLRPTMYRRSNAFTADPGALASWLRLAELNAARIKTAPYDADKVRASIDSMRSMSRLPGVEWRTPLSELCASVGIALVIVKELPQCRVNGATRWISPDKAMIALSLRYRRNDIFWFSLFHELGHLLLHSKKETFIDGTDTVDPDLELGADAFAARVLIPPKTATQLPQLTTLGEVEDFARESGIAPAVVVGRMQHDGLIPHRQWPSAFVRYRFDDEP